MVSEELTFVEESVVSCSCSGGKELCSSRLNCAVSMAVSVVLMVASTDITEFSAVSCASTSPADWATSMWARTALALSLWLSAAGRVGLVSVGAGM